ncbi:ATP-dependent 6-phosphofructokinase [Allocoleopsis franciscana]|uniref:ATP-dependent 6-phosphofructokinase n=1 Tax=Allocoleopsis franciscana PCC 7113 TaxID=1173027 RepID=K9WEJ9_9CYAN|nr:ATP-dependent 6-phosphofructokinase [Allocoleopsis franciscana]AFZ18835.1 6-phosphofructokinase [Allocoleopsis franciscana PCC 7113]
MKTQKRIGILTSGGDCPGLNAVIRAVVSHATLTYDWEVIGIPYATQGLLEQKAIALSRHGLDLRGIDPLLSMGGTILGSINKGNTLEHADEIIASYQALALDALIAVGGDGSLSILNDLACRGNWQLVAVPKTIDNDVALTERSIGFDTAVNTITDALNRLTFTAASHDRVMIVEVMGRSTGHLALHAGIAGGADVILLPEIPYSIQGVCRTLAELRDRWAHKFAIVVVAEGAKTTNEVLSCDPALPSLTPQCGIGQYIAEQISRYSTMPIDTRVSVLGHIQRGGIPSALDRLVATTFGKAAVDLVAQGQLRQMVAWQNGRVVAVPLAEVLAHSPLPVDPNGYLVKTAQALGIYVGDVLA